MLREHGVVGKFVEFFKGMAALSRVDRATIANMRPSTARRGFFPVDRTLEYMHPTGREAEHVAGVEAYCRAQGLWYDSAEAEKAYTDVLRNLQHQAGRGWAEAPSGPCGPGRDARPLHRELHRPARSSRSRVGAG